MGTRDKLLGRKKRVRAELVKLQIDGEEVAVEVRQPSIGVANHIDAKTYRTDKDGVVTTDRDAQIVEVLLACCYDPAYGPDGEWRKGESAKPLFEAADRDAILAEPLAADGWPALLLRKARELMSTASAEAAEAGKGSGGTPPDASSSG